MENNLQSKIVYSYDGITITFREDYINNDENYFRRRIYDRDGNLERDVVIKNGKKHGLDQFFNRKNQRCHIITFNSLKNSLVGSLHGISIFFNR